MILRIKSMEPCLIITASGVFKLKDGKMKRLEPDPLLAWINRAFWLHHALDKDFDPEEHVPEVSNE